MNKKFIAFALVLLIAMGGLFAALGIGFDDTPKVTLEVVIGGSFYHGIVDGSSYLASKTYVGAFADTPPTVKYGYESNMAGPHYLRMAISDFVYKNESGTEVGRVKIKSVTVDNATGTWNSATSEYTIFTIPATNSYSKQSAEIVVSPMRVAGTDHLGATVTAVNTIDQAPEGTYEATITFSVAGS